MSAAPSHLENSPNQTDMDNRLTLICISDLHSHSLPTLPPGDLLIVAGDLTEGKPDQLLSRLSELADIRSRYTAVIVIGGNHDRALDPYCDQRDGEIFQDIPERLACRKRFSDNFGGITYLENSGTEINIGGRKLKIWGSPGSLASSKQTAFGYTCEEAKSYWEEVPDDTDILITHGPPAGYLDTALGCLELEALLWRVRPKVHVFGHIHKGRGTHLRGYDDSHHEYQEKISEILKEKRKATAGKYIPRAKREANMNAELPTMPTYQPEAEPGTVLVNAALMGNLELGAVEVFM